ncbi:MAG: glutamate racemase [Thermodesulfobacteriota bacterium]
MSETPHNNKSIGVFDSGIGGLTVVKEIVKLLPGENLVYLGDTARVPYGTKSRNTVIRYAESNTNFLLSKGIKILIVACNTASAYSLDNLKKNLSIPVIGVIEPGAKKAAEITSTRNIGVIGTPSTIRSGAYTRALLNINGDLKIYQKPCPLFVPLAEEGWHDGDIVCRIAEKYLDEILNQGIDVMILGCTHYPLLKDTIKKVAGDGVTLVDSAEETANELYQQIESGKLINSEGNGLTREFYLTDDSETFVTISGKFLGNEISEIKVTDII